MGAQLDIQTADQLLIVRLQGRHRHRTQRHRRNGQTRLNVRRLVIPDRNRLQEGRVADVRKFELVRRGYQFIEVVTAQVIGECGLAQSGKLHGYPPQRQAGVAIDHRTGQRSQVRKRQLKG